MITRILFILCFLFGIDLYAFQGFSLATGHSQVANAVYFLFTGIAFISMFIYFGQWQTEKWGISRPTFSGLSFMAFAPKLFTALLLIPEDLLRLVKWLINSMAALLNMDLYFSNDRSAIWATMALSASILLTLLFVYGAIFNVYRYSLKKVPLQLLRLPKSFHGLKVVQISDIHSGSLTNKEAVEKAVQRINALQPDLIFFTGDLVNNIAHEAIFLQDTLGKLRATHGVYSILGNHDYGDYASWPSEAHKTANLLFLKNIHAEMGWRLLMNEHVVIESEGQQIIVAGVENWSASNRFPKYGKLHHALAGAAEDVAILLLSHDPSHWEAEILHHPVPIDATFSGHTHGMQFGFEWGKWRWSPVKYAYKQWAGLYEKAGKFLYVNRGFGVIGYRGRVGIMPEITLFTLLAPSS
jgi:predicted MPP superfamily phosphohydrolase